MAAEGTKMWKTEEFYCRRMGGIPYDLVHDILVPLPAKSLVRFKCVSKGWRSLISSHDFAKLNLNHINQGTSNDYGHRIILSSLDSILSIKYDPSSCGAVERRAERLGFPFKGSHLISKVLGSCNGLLCLAIYRVSRSNASILIWNPCIPDKFELVPAPQSGLRNFACGFGYDQRSDDYKVVSIGDDDSWLAAAIYSLKAKAWHTTKRLLLRWSPINSGDDGGDGGTFVDGMLYWISRDRNHLIGFHLENENFELVRIPQRTTRTTLYAGAARLGLCTSSEGSHSCLLIVNFGWDRILEVWKLLRPKVHDDRWTKFMTIAISGSEEMCTSIVPLCFGNGSNGKVLVALPAFSFCSSYYCIKCKSGDYTFWVYDPKTGGFQHQVCDLTLPDVRGYQYYWFPIPCRQRTTHVHTLVSPTSF